jgi:hypothetical protein
MLLHSWRKMYADSVHAQPLRLQISQTADEFGAPDRTAMYSYPTMTKTMIPRVSDASMRLPVCVEWR